ncbi:MAG: hypothetical protein PHS02_03735 [Candidatus ainarchaeum sp.]|nr:hypothetical protein [Candidatus ainarchaeum sp.]
MQIHKKIERPVASTAKLTGGSNATKFPDVCTSRMTKEIFGYEKVLAGVKLNVELLAVIKKEESGERLGSIAAGVAELSRLLRDLSKMEKNTENQQIVSDALEEIRMGLFGIPVMLERNAGSEGSVRGLLTEFYNLDITIIWIEKEWISTEKHAER